MRAPAPPSQSAGIDSRDQVPPQVNIVQNYRNPHSCGPVSRPDMAGSPSLQADSVHARVPPPPSPTHPISRNRQSRSGPPPVNIAQNYPNPHPCVPVSRPDMAGSPGFQGKGGIHRNISEKGHRCSWPPPLPLLTCGCLGHSVGNWRRRAAWVGLKSTLEKPPVTSQNPSCTHAISLTLSVPHLS